jgi:hypothetical protein
MQANFTSRAINVIDLSSVVQQEHTLHPELLALKLAHRVNPLDVGGIVYSRRKKVKNFYLVDTSSVLSTRRTFLISLLDKFCVLGSSDRSIHTEFKLIEYALEWCDSNGFCDVLCDADCAREAFVTYTNYLFEKVLGAEKLSPTTGSMYQWGMKRALEVQFPEVAEYVTTGVPVIQPNRDGLEPPEERNVRQYVDVTLVIAFTLSRFLTKSEKYPLRFETNEYHTYIFPGNGKFITPLTEHAHGSMAYDYKLGRIKSVEEVVREYPDQTLWAVKQAIEGANKAIFDGNSDHLHQFRMRLASITMRAFACLINLVVGANSSEFVKFLYDDAIALIKSPLKNELSAIKLRAKGLEVNYPVGRGPGMEILREYIKFREWILNGRETEYLFFQAWSLEGIDAAPGPLETEFSSRFYSILKGVFIPKDMANIPPRLVRKHKSLILHQLRHSPLLVSAVLNHSESMNSQRYSGITVAEQTEEYKLYWAAVRKAAERVKNSADTPGVSISVGHCEAIDKPQKDIPIVAIEPDCNTQYGCLFCVHYLLHSDETDLHKLLSFLYVVEGVRVNAPNFQFSEEVFKDLVVRINAIVEAISSRSEESAELVVAVKKKVFDLGILTVFWEKRLQRYEKMGIYF